MVLIVLALLILVVYFRSREQLEKEREQEAIVGSRFTTPRYLREDARARELPSGLRRRFSESDFARNQPRYERMMDQAVTQVHRGGGRRVSCDPSLSSSTSGWGESPMSHMNRQMGQKRLRNSMLSLDQEESARRKLRYEIMRLGIFFSIHS